GYLEKLAAGLPPVCWEEDTGPETEMSETVFLGLRLIEGLDLEGFRERDGSKNLSAKRNELSRGEKEFYDYMGGKLNTILDRVLSKSY
ncbi:MAG: hypothetical protein K6T16_02600, partial [Candidatus Pacearchaeota archaeon]|nr:hypothetical protein [Candidatus Pacearchaeota archaeon]